MNSAQRYSWLAHSRTLLVDAYWPPLNPELDFNAEDMVRAALELGADSIRFGTAGKYALIRNGIFPEHPALAGRDLLNEALASSKRAGLRLIAYVPVSHGLPRSLLSGLRPQWALRLENGEAAQGVRHFGGEPLHPVCPFGAYRADILRFIAHIVNSYEIDGLYLDGPYYDWNMETRSDVCHCAACAEGFGAATGLPLPQSPSLGGSNTPELIAAFRNWVAQGLLQLLRDINAIAKTRDLPLLFNAYSCANRPAEYERLMIAESDGILLETGLGGLRGVGIGRGQGKIVWRYTQPHNGYPRKSTRRQEEDNARLAFETVMWGGAPIVSYGGRFCCGATTETPLREVFAFLREEEEFFARAVNQSAIGLLCLSRIGDRDPANNAALQGLYLALQARGLPVRIISGAGLHSAQEMQGIKILLLPSLQLAGAAELSALRDLLASGVRVLACCGDGQEKQITPEAAALFGISPTGTPSERPQIFEELRYWAGDWDIYLRPGAELAELSTLAPDTLLPHGGMAHLQPLTDSRTLAHFSPGGRNGQQLPAIIEAKGGAGGSILLCFDLGGAYAAHPEAELEALLAGLLELSLRGHGGLDELCAYEISGAEGIRSMLLQDGERRILLLLNAREGGSHAYVERLRWKPANGRAPRGLRTLCGSVRHSGISLEGNYFEVSGLSFAVFAALELAY